MPDFPPLKNDLLLRVLRGEPVPRPPVWMMRQAGRYLPSYRELQAQHEFFTRVQTPELAAAITLQPVEQLGVDAAILFSDILVMLQAFGVTVQMEPSQGPVIPQPLRTAEDAFKLTPTDVAGNLSYVYEALTLTRHLLQGKVPLIGFAGAPWTLFCYWVEGRGSKDFALPKAFCYQQPAAAHHVLNLLADATAEYLNLQIAAGAQAVQLFDSWAGLLGPEDFNQFALPYLQQVVSQVKGAPLILFAKGAWYGLPQLAATGAACLGLDWTVSPAYARQQAGATIALQGNLDPSWLLLPVQEVQRRTQAMVQAFGTQRYIANLGHGILPNVPVAHAKAFVQAVQQMEPVYAG